MISGFVFSEVGLLDVKVCFSVIDAFVVAENCLGFVLLSVVVLVAVPDVGVNVLVLTVVFRGCIVVGLTDSLIAVVFEIDDVVLLVVVVAAVVSLIVGGMVDWVDEIVVEEEPNVFFFVVFLSAVCCEGVVVPEVFVCLLIYLLMLRILLYTLEYLRKFCFPWVT